LQDALNAVRAEIEEEDEEEAGAGK
jgi:hypothetical protein